MKYLFFLLEISFSLTVQSQNKVKKFSASIQSYFYSYGDGTGSLNNLVRNTEGLSFTYKAYDTVKKNGMIFEFLTNTTTAYYKTIIGNNTILEVTDFHTNLNFIFPFLIVYRNRIEHCFGVGIGVGSLAGRDYLDENNNILPYNTTNLKKIKFGKYWTSSLLLDYELDLKFSKRLGFNFGLRYATSTPVQSRRVDYIITQGTGISFKYGMFYQLK